MSAAGEEKAWEIIAGRDPKDICRAAVADYDSATGTFRVRSFGMEFMISVRERSITSTAAGSEVLLRRLGEFFRLSILWYLANAKDVPGTGRMTKIGSIKGGDAFSRGSHVLPLDRLAQKFGSDKEGFVAKGKRLGGEAERIADAGLRLAPLPRVPVVLSLWLADDEFPARVDLLLDSSCELQLPPDIVWSVAMMSVLIMMM